MVLPCLTQMLLNELHKYLKKLQTHLFLFSMWTLFLSILWGLILHTEKTQCLMCFFTCPCLCVCFSAASAHASHQWVSNEKKPEAHRLERHDAGAAPGYSQWPAFADREWVDHTPQNIHTYTKPLTSVFHCRNEQDSKWGKTCTCILTPTLLSGCESTFIYVSQFKELHGECFPSAFTVTALYRSLILVLCDE